MRHHTIPLLTVLLLSSAAHAGYVEGLSACNKNNHATAMSEWQPLAEQGDMRA